MALFTDGKFYCECGCGTEINPWCTWMPGHYVRTEWHREFASKHFSKINSGLIRSGEARRNMSEAKLQAYRDDPTYKERMVASLQKIDHDEVWCRNISEAKLRAFREDPTLAKKISERLTGKTLSDETRRNMSEAQQRLRREDPTFNERAAEARRGLGLGPLSKEHKEAISRGKRRYWASLSAEEREAKMQLLWTSCHKRPTRTEALLDEYLQEDFPGKWKYVGGGKVDIGDRNPDFISTNGQKAVIELFGSQFHSLDSTSSRSEEGTLRHYRKYGYSCLVVWVDTTDELLFVDVIRLWILLLG